MKIRAAAVFAAVISLICLSGLAEAIDYSDGDNWAYYAVNPEKDCDLFLIRPTVDMGGDGNMNIRLDDAAAKASFVGALNMERGIYEDTLTMYAPFYRQVTLPVEFLPDSQAGRYKDIAYQDVRAAFTVFLTETGNRPFVLAGFSQGSDMALRLMKDMFGDSEIRERLAAAYLIGWRLTEADVIECPWLTPARGETDTGVIVTFSTEADFIEGSDIMPEGMWTYSINPLNWKTDGTVADRSENKGACFTDYEGNVVSEITGLTGAYIDPERGTVKATDIKAADYAGSLFPDGVYHLYDYQFFYRNLEENVARRVSAFLENGN